MSNKQLFLKSIFPRAPLQNGLGRHICQLQRITLKFCKNDGSSKGIREYLEKDVIDFSKQNPGIIVYVKPRRNRTPVMVAEYLNGVTEWINCRNYRRDEVQRWLDLLRTQNGQYNARLKKMWYTNVPSCQSPWSPYTHKIPNSNIFMFPDEDLSSTLNNGKSATKILLDGLDKKNPDELANYSKKN